MASDRDLGEAEPLVTASAINPTSSTIPPASSSDILVADPAQSRPAKRARDITPTPPSSTIGAELSPSKIARLVGYATHSPAPLTGAAALEDERRRKEIEQRMHPPGTSPNPSNKVISELLSGTVPTSRALDRPQDAPTIMTTSAADTAAKALQPGAVTSTNAPLAEMKDTSPQSTTSAASLVSGADRVVGSPGTMEVDSRSDRLSAAQPDAQMDDRTSTSLSYPGILPTGATMAAPAPPSRGMSLPMANNGTPDHGPRSPSSKKHKCPYCATEFTRHHNLKSHLLTHSQEKPYLCQSCQMRFRRLHDLKRHSKLHTGEKNHVCPKCDRKFARGDALARHSKGGGGCAGRRASTGSFAGDEEYEGDGTDADESSMTGVVYDGAAEGDMTEDERRRLSLPSIKAQHVSGQPAAEGYAPLSRTYPPAGPRLTPSGGLFPPSVDRGSSSSNASPSMPNSITSTSRHTPNTSISSMPMSAGGSSLYSQSGITESPKPLSPGQSGHDKRPRSPSMTAHLQQHLGHRPSDHQVAAGLTLPPHGASQSSASGSLTGSKGGPRGRPSITAGNVDNTNNLFASGESGLWAYVQSMEDKVKRLTDEMLTMKKTETQLIEKVSNLEKHETALTSEVAVLRQQLGPRHEALPPMSTQQ